MFKLFKCINQGTLILVIALANGLSGAIAHAQENIHSSPVRLDAPLTPANSYLNDFGYGAILRIPKSLNPTLDFAHIKQPVQSEQISMVFWFPDMTQTRWAAQINTIFEKQGHTYVPQSDRFRVNILYLFYSPGELGNPKSFDDKRVLPDLRPPSMLRWQQIVGGIAAHKEPVPPKFDQVTPAQMRRVPSGFSGIDVLDWMDWIKIHPDASIHHPQEGGIYVAKPKSPYELWMNCGSFESIECDAYVYSKKHHFQYHMIFPPEAVAHTDELIRAIDKMIDQWIAKYLSNTD